MNKSKLALLVLALSIMLFSGCVPKQPQLSRQQWIDNTTHIYDNITKEQAIISAEQVLKLADGDDFLIVHDEDGFYASRRWTVYLVLAAAMGTDYWKVIVEEIEDSKIKVKIQVNSQANAITPMATTGGDWTATSTPMAGQPVNGTSIYDLFWSRFEYLIKKRTEWLSCKESDNKIKRGITWGTNEALCNSFNIKDDVPNGVIK